MKGLTWKSASFSVAVNRHYDLPRWAGKDTLVVCSSYSGNTEETLSVFRQTLKRKLPLLVVSTGGELLYTRQGKEACLIWRLPAVYRPGRPWVIPSSPS